MRFQQISSVEASPTREILARIIIRARILYIDSSPATKSIGSEKIPFFDVTQQLIDQAVKCLMYFRFYLVSFAFFSFPYCNF